MASMTRKTIRVFAKVLIGVMALVWIRWTPDSLRAWIWYTALTIAIFGLAAVAAPKHEGYWPSEGNRLAEPDHKGDIT